MLFALSLAHADCCSQLSLLRGLVIQLMKTNNAGKLVCIWCNGLFLKLQWCNWEICPHFQVPDGFRAKSDFLKKCLRCIIFRTSVFKLCLSCPVYEQGMHFPLLFQEMWFMVVYCTAGIAKWASKLSQEEASLGAVQGWGPDLVHYFTLKEWPCKKWNLCPAWDLAPAHTMDWTPDPACPPRTAQWDFSLSVPVSHMPVVFLAGIWGLGRTQAELASSWVWTAHPPGKWGQVSRRDEIAEQHTLTSFFISNLGFGSRGLIWGQGTLPHNFSGTVFFQYFL